MRPTSHAPTRAQRAARRRRLARKFFLRFHMALILAGAAGAAVVASKLLSVLGVASLAWRYPLAAILAYGSFFGLLWLWRGYVAGEGRDFHGAARELAQEGAEEAVELGIEGAAEVAEAAGEGASEAGGLADAVPIEGGEEALLVILVIAALTPLVGGAWLVWDAPVILAEVGIEAAFASGLGIAARRTWKTFAAILLAAAVAGFAIEGLRWLHEKRAVTASSCMREA